MSSHDYVHAAVPVLTNRGLLCPAEEKVHFSLDYDNIDLPTRLPGRKLKIILLVCRMLFAIFSII